MLLELLRDAARDVGGEAALELALALVAGAWLVLRRVYRKRSRAKMLSAPRSTQLGRADRLVGILRGPD